MKNNRKDRLKKERVIMITSSAFVLAALTLTGVYMRNQNNQVKDDGYTIDLSAMDNTAQEKYEEIAQNEELPKNEEGSQKNIGEKVVLENEDDLDYLPTEDDPVSRAGSSQVEIPGLSGAEKSLLEEANSGDPMDQDQMPEDQKEGTSTQETGSTEPVISTELHFAGASAFARPISGEILLPYSMDGSIYFKTLDQYKYNPATIYSAKEGDAVGACAEGQVLNIFDSAELGHALVLDLGDGYQATYGQLKDIQYTVGSYVDKGTVIASVAAPTKYYCLEGDNLYFQLTKDGVPVDPQSLN